MTGIEDRYREIQKANEERWFAEWRAEEKAKREQLKKDNELAKEVAKEPPVYINRKYAFVHILLRRDGRKDTFGRHIKAICGNEFWSDNPVSTERIDRPLCGNCRNKWEKLTGERLPR